MRIFTDMDSLPRFRSPVVTVGSFDGVHRGHRFLLDVVRRRAEIIDGESVVVTFDRHPRTVTGSGEGLVMLTSPERKAELLADAGVDNLVVMPFDEDTARMSPKDFVRDFIVGRLGARELVVGYNHRFGRGRSGDAAMLHELEAKYGFAIVEAPRFGGEVCGSDRSDGSDGSGGDVGEKISSTVIREALARGDIDTAERLLGHEL